MINQHFVIVGAFIALLGNLTYVVDTLKGNNQPNRVSWFMWTLFPLIAFVAEVQQGVGLQALLTFIAGFNPLLVLTASFVNKKAVWKLGRFDFVCGGFALLGLVLWLLSGQGNVAIGFSILADGAASLPTIAKSYTHPESEGWINYLCAAIAAALTLLTLKHWTFAAAGFPLYLLLDCVILVVLVRFELGRRLNRLLSAA